MTDIILYISIIVVSGIVGSKVRAYRDRLGWTGTVQTMAIVLLVVLMGARMGANEEIIDNLGTIGLAAFAMTIAMMIGSLLCLFFARKALGFTKDAKIAALHCDALTEAAMEEEAEVEAEKHGINKMTLIILSSSAWHSAIWLPDRCSEKISRSLIMRRALASKSVCAF